MENFEVLNYYLHHMLFTMGIFIKECIDIKFYILMALYSW